MNASTPLTLPPLPDYADDLQWLTAYLAQHMLSHSSWVYAWILWIAIGVVFLTATILHWTRSRGGYLGALWSKWALRRRTWRKKRGLAAAQRKGQSHRQPQALPSNAQILTITVLFLSALALSFAGPDNLAPGAQLWNLSKYPSVNRLKRYDVDDYTYLQPQFTINKAWWTSGDRTGLISFALFPLVVLLGLKGHPFAILSSPLTLQLFFDKLALLHRWCGFLSWILATLHTVFWATQLALDHRARTGVIGFDYAWKFQRFQYAWAAYASFTLLMLCSIPALRRHHYETFYFTHIIFFPVMLICSALHHPPVAWWCWGALALWIAERCYRFTWWLNTNGFLGGVSTSTLAASSSKSSRSSSPPHTSLINPDTLPMHALGQPNALGRLPTLPRIDPTLKAPRHQVVTMADAGYTPPPGYVHAELLPGRTVRIRLVTPLFLSWHPGQHFLINIPSISRLTSHPFTCASVCDSLAEHDSGREIVMFIRAKKGWTKRLWDTVAVLTAQGKKYADGETMPEGFVMPQRGVLMRGYVDGPFGSAARARWGEHSSVVLFAGGSGVSFALSVLEYVCMCMGGRDGKELGGRRGGFGTKGFNISRVRFVWIVSQFSHVHWCAHALRKCMAMVSSSELQIDIFVTTGKTPLMKSVKPPPVSINPLAMKTEDPLIPPTPMFVLEEQETRRSSLDKQQDVPEDITGTPRTSFESDGSADEDIDLSYYTSEDMGDRNGELGHEEHILDLTNFEDDDDTALPGEAALNEAVRKEGSVRRSFFRRSMHIGMLKTSKMSFDSPRQLRPMSEAISPVDPTVEPTIRLVGERPRSLAMMALGRNTRLSMSNFQPHSYSPASTSAATTPTSSAPLLSDRNNPRFVFPPPSHPLAQTHIPLSPLAHSSVLSPIPSRTPSPSPTLYDRRSSYASSKRPDSIFSQWSDAHSLAALVSEAAAQEHIRLELEDEELTDISVVAERARAGRPAIQKILADEVQRASGSVIVGCCGPTSLNAVVRKNVAALIDPEKVRRGEGKGMIDLIAEDFGY